MASKVNIYGNEMLQGHFVILIKFHKHSIDVTVVKLLTVYCVNQIDVIYTQYTELSSKCHLYSSKLILVMWSKKFKQYCNIMLSIVKKRNTNDNC